MAYYSGQGNDGTNSGADYSSDGKFGTSLYFDGADTLDCGAAGNFTNTNAFSTIVWVKGSPSEDGIMQRYDGTKGWALFTTSSGTLLIDIRHNSTSYVRRRSTNSISGGDWHQIVVTYDGSETFAGTHIYIDGVLDDSAAGGADTLDGSITTTTNCKIGILHTYGNYSFIGNIDEIALYNKELTVKDLLEIVNILRSLKISFRITDKTKKPINSVQKAFWFEEDGTKEYKGDFKIALKKLLKNGGTIMLSVEKSKLPIALEYSLEDKKVIHLLIVIFDKIKDESLQKVQEIIKKMINNNINIKNYYT